MIRPLRLARVRAPVLRPVSVSTRLLHQTPKSSRVATFNEHHRAPAAEKNFGATAAEVGTESHDTIPIDASTTAAQYPNGERPYPDHVAAQAAAQPSAAASPSGIAGAGPQFLQRLSANDLFCFTVLSAMTSKQLLPMAIKMMPYVPNFLIKRFVYPVYCGGENFDEVVATGDKLFRRGFGNMMISYSVEDAEGSSGSGLMDSAVKSILGSVDQVLAKHYDNAVHLYESGAATITAPCSGYVALKPTGLMSQATDILRNFDKPAYAEKWQAYLDVCRTICSYAETHGKGKVVIVFDAEKRDLQEGVYEAQRVMMREFNRNGNVIVAGTIQMYLQDSLDVLKTDMELAKRDNYQVAMKLVRGAYLHSEKDRWNTIHTSKENTDKCYNDGITMMLDSIIDGWRRPGTGPIDGVRPVAGRLIVASHNVDSCLNVDQRITNEAPLGVDLQKDESVVFGQLLGMTEDLGEELARRGRKVVKYVPWGPTQETKDYLRRRLEENGDAVREGGWTYVKYGLLEGIRRVIRV